jgi:hypothetical protein
MDLLSNQPDGEYLLRYKTRSRIEHWSTVSTTSTEFNDGAIHCFLDATIIESHSFSPATPIKPAKSTTPECTRRQR